MRKVIILSFLSLDGVVQAPGGPEEDASGGFQHGGWTVPYFDEALGSVMDRQMEAPFDLLLGRRTYDIFRAYWPEHPEEGEAINRATKYVATRTPIESGWGTVALGEDVVEEIRVLKQGEGPDLHVHGSANFIQTLLAADLVDELWLKVFPVTLGAGKRLFAEGTMPAAFELQNTEVTPKGVIVANYARSGDVRTGSF